MYNPRLGLITMVTGDYRRVAVAIKNVTAFDSVASKLMRGDVDVTATYIVDNPSTSGNMIFTRKIGGLTAMPHGSYRYFITGTYNTNKVRSWYWDIIVLPTDLNLLKGIDLSQEDYDPFVDELTIYEGDTVAKDLTVPDAIFTAASGILTRDGTDVTATYCSGAAGFSGDTLSSHNIGGQASIPSGEYAYFLTGTYNEGDAKSTWIYKLTVVPKFGVLP